jgi:predicted enzyme related to lactoylglutathione lyase
MRDHDGYPAGVPSWVDVQPSGLEAAKRFYGGLFGWEWEDRTPPGSSGYFVARLRGGDVAGVGSLFDDAPTTAGWNTYVSVDSADAAADRVTAAGGKLVSGPRDIPGVSRVAACTDPDGATFRLWEPKGHVGAHRVNEPGTWNMSELSARDLERAKTFYAAVFGWETSTVQFGSESGTMLRLPGYGDFIEEKLDPTIRHRQAEEGVPPGFEDAIGWMSAIGSDAAAEEAPRWSITFAVDDTDAIAERAAQLGGQVVVPPFDVGGNVRLAILTDPEGTVFTVNRYGPAEEAAERP